MQNLQKIFIYSLLILAFDVKAQSSCVLMGAEAITAVAEVAKTLEEIPVVKFNRKFCRALDECGNNESLEDEKNKISYQKQYFENLPASILQQQKYLKDVQDQISALEKTDKNNENLSYLKSNLKSRQERLKDLESDLKKYEAYKADPKLPHPMKEKGVGLTPEEKVAYLMKKKIEGYEKIPEKIAELKKEMEQQLENYKNSLEKAKPVQKKYYEEQIAKIPESYAKRIKAQEDIYSKYQAHLDDPKKDPEFFEKSFEVSWQGEIVVTDFCSTAENTYKSVAKDLQEKKSGACGLSPEELVMMKFYTDAGFICLNNHLRGKYVKPSNDDLIKILDSALTKIPSYQGLVRRGASLPPEVDALHTVGSVLSYDAFTSTSTGNGMHSSGTFLIYSKTGKPVMGFSAHTGEYEVLFRSRTKFKVLSVSQKETGSGKVYVMKEVTDDGGKEDPEMEKKLLAMIKEKSQERLKLLKEGKYRDVSPDTWSCPLEGTLPPSVPQKNLPTI